MNKPLILVTNDDGINSPGLKAAVESAFELGEVLIVAPDRQQTAMSRAEPMPSEYGVIKEVDLEIKGKSFKAFSLVGTPALCVAYAVMEIASRKIDLCISGINYGENLGTDVTASGTVGAALEADSFYIPAIASSLEYSPSLQFSEDFQEINWEIAVGTTSRFAKQMLNGNKDGYRILNINVPESADSETPVKLTFQSRQAYFDWIKPENRDFSKPSKLHVKRINKNLPEDGSDIDVFCVKKEISVTPMAGDLTAR